jgi:4-amino-4-deoxy-L-arabinose transferase-like glycosyltransferase
MGVVGRGAHRADAAVSANSRYGAESIAVEPFATAPIVGIAVAVTVLLVAVSGRYGYHRDELYFLAAGRHLAWGYPDQPPFVALLARLLSAIAPGSVSVLRVPSALAAGSVVVLAGLSARELGAGRSAQALAAASMATGAVLLGSGHLLSTATFNFLAWSLLLWLIVRLLRTGNQRTWIVIGVVAGVGLLDSNLVAFLLGAVAAGLLLAGPRHVFRSPWLWVGGLIAALMWAPYLAWQASHGWPQFEISRSIAAGHSGSSQPRSLLLPEQLVLLSPYVAPVWIAGLVSLVRDPGVRWCRAIAVAYALLGVIFVATGGKSYYLAGLFPILLGAGAQPAINWVNRGRRSLRRNAIIGGLALAGVGSVVATLPVLPVASLHNSPIVSFNYDTGETVGWPALVDEIAGAYRSLPPADRRAAAIVATNYGEAGAIDRFGPALGLPHAYGIHNGYWYWGPPPDSATEVLAVGFSANELGRFCSASTLVTRLDNGVQLENDEQGRPVWLCSQIKGRWGALWRDIRNLG